MANKLILRVALFIALVAMHTGLRAADKSHAFPGHAVKKAIDPIFEHFLFKIDPACAVRDLLPVPPKAVPSGGPLTIGDLAQVPEVSFQEPLTVTVPLVPSDAEKAKLDSARRMAMIRTAHQIAKINMLNETKPDYFMEVLVKNRPDLSGLPFMMGDACRLKREERGSFGREVLDVRQCLAAGKRRAETKEDACNGFWKYFDESQKDGDRLSGFGHRFTLAALTQILGPESEYHPGVVQHLPALEKTVADKNLTTQILARFAVFSTDPDVRLQAGKALQKRDTTSATAILLHGLRYPWPSVARNAAETVVRLKRNDLLPELVNMLEQPDPRAPVATVVEGKKAAVVRELVRINHHRNCLLCHPPGNTKDVISIQKIGESTKDQNGIESVKVHAGVRGDVVVGAVPIPGEPLPESFFGYHNFASPDILIRADATYLRQDFSLLQKVADAAPWPEMQRFDYIVPSRALLTDKEVQSYQAAFSGQNSSAPYHQIALNSLRQLTGRDAGATAEAWRSVLKMTK